MEHRGPDSRGVFVDDGVGLGVQRLAVIDVAGGDQPIFNEDRSIAVVSNGEIYNHLDLRRDLLRRGHRFTTRSDTEVLVHLYEEFGEAMVERLRGMFAFAIWDAERRRIVCARDRVGKKPLYWARQGSRVWFASEIRALLEDVEIGRDVEPTAIAAYLALQYVPYPLSVFKAIRKVPPASVLVVTEERETLRQYWSLDYSRKLEGVQVDDLADELWAHLREATGIRLMSEVPLGAFLSGGIDSSAIVAAMADQTAEPVRTFSIGFTESSYDELHYARAVAQRFATEHHEYVVGPSETRQMMPRLARHYGEPFGDSSAIPTFYLAELTRRHVTVVLNGDGGDETLGGYERYSLNRTLNWVPKLPPHGVRLLACLRRDEDQRRGFRTRRQRLAPLLGMSPANRYATLMSIFDANDRSRLLTPEFLEASRGHEGEAHLTRPWHASTAGNLIDRMLDTDVQTYLPGDGLTKTDIATMAHSLEARSPFLDHHLMEFAAGLPAQFKLAWGAGGKTLLKRALRGRLPDEILKRRKMGFAVPLARWFRGELRTMPGEILLDGEALSRGYFQRTAIERLIDEHQRGTHDHSHRLWVLLQLEMWHREVVSPPSAAQRTGANV